MSAQHLSANGLDVLGVPPLLGRVFHQADGPPGEQAQRVVVLTYRFWQRHFGGRPEAVGQTLFLNREPYTVIGVLPRQYFFTGPEVLVPLDLTFDTNFAWGVQARLKRGVTPRMAEQRLQPLFDQFAKEAPQRFPKEVRPLVRSLVETQWAADFVPTLLLIFAASMLLLLLACANVSILLLARGTSRAHEFAVRAAIGASRGRLMRQLLVESLVLAVLGAATGVVVSRWTLDVIASSLPPEAASTLDFRIDRTVIMFAGLLAVATGFLFGLFPALHSTRPSLVTALREDAGQKGAARGASRFRVTLATVQIALSMALLAAAGLFVRSLVNVSRVDLGIRTENLITFAISPELNGYTPERSRALFERVEEDVAALPGVSGISASLVPLLSGSNWGSSVSVQGFQAGPDTDTHSNYNEIGPDYYRTIGIPLLAGREFTRADAAGAGKVAIVNEAFAKKFNLGRDAVGKYMSDSTGNNVKLDIQIVGLVQDAKYSEVKQEPPPLFTRPYRQDERLGRIGFYVRTALEPEQLMPSINSVIARLEPNLPVENMKTMDQQVRENVFLDRMISTLSASFAVLATILAAVGLYGVLAYTVAQRTREIGVRMALGADGARVRGMMLRQVALMTLIGGSIGLAGAMALGQAAESLLFRMKGTDPFVLVSAAVLLVVVAFAAGLLPAQRAARIDPMIALRYE